MFDGNPVFASEENAGELRTVNYGTAHVMSIHRESQGNTMTTHLADRIARRVAALDRGRVTNFFILRGSQSPNFAQKLVPTEMDQLFCTGPDLAVLSSQGWDAQKAYYGAEARLINTLVNTTKPWAVAYDGTALGVGAGMGLHSVFRLCSGSSVWALPETSYGAVPTYGSSFELPHLDGELGTYLALTGRRLVGHDLLWAGLASHVVDPTLYGELSLLVSKQNSTELQHILPVLSVFDQAGTEKEEPYSLRPHLDTIAKCFRGDSIERIREALKAEGTPFANKTLAKLSEKSPAALKLTLRLLREGRAKNDIVQSLQMEHSVALRLWKDTGSDLHVGLKTVVFGNGKAPSKWPCAATDSYIEKMFAAPTNKDEVLTLAPLKSRPPHEAPHLMNYYETWALLDSAPPVNEEVSLEPLPDADKVSVGEDELARLIAKSGDKVHRVKTLWEVEELESEAGSSVQQTSFGDIWVGVDNATEETIPVPANIKAQIQADYGERPQNIRIVRHSAREVHPDLAMAMPEEVAEIRGVLRGALEIPALPESAPDRVLSSESYEVLMSKPYLDLDEEVEHMLKLLGHVEKTPEETDADDIPNVDGMTPVLSKQPLTKREESI